MQRQHILTGAGKRDAVDGISRTSAVKPQRNRAKPEPTEADKPDADPPTRRKTVVPRRTPARGKYIDEYARPAV